MAAFKGMENPPCFPAQMVWEQNRSWHSADKHDTVGIDCVATCVNDVAACAGGRSHCFSWTIACGKCAGENHRNHRKGVAYCSQKPAVLIGGETAEMPGFYPEDEHDLPDLQLASWIKRPDYR